MAEEDDIMMAWVRVNTLPVLMTRISEAADNIQYGFRLHGTISAHDYKEARNSLMINNILRQRGDFIRNPEVLHRCKNIYMHGRLNLDGFHCPSADAVPTVVVGTMIMFNRSLRRYGVNGFVVRFPNWVQPIPAVRIRQAAAVADVDVLDGVFN